jgi:ERCC4-related helicase
MSSKLKINPIPFLDVEIITGLGKTFIAFKAMLSMPANSNCLFLAETTVN